jgi:uncharacterized protein CbrC (UPF0167 family)
MLELLYRIFVGHNHTWQIICTTDIYAKDNDTMPRGKRYTLQCIHCGEIKIKKDYK